MLKLGALLNLGLAVSEGMLSVRWFTQAKENDWEPKRIFYGVIWALNAVMQVMLACTLLEGAVRERAETESYDEDEDDFDF